MFRIPRSLYPSLLGSDFPVTDVEMWATSARIDNGATWLDRICDGWAAHLDPTDPDPYDALRAVHSNRFQIAYLLGDDWLISKGFQQPNKADSLERPPAELYRIGWAWHAIQRKPTANPDAVLSGLTDLTPF